jgi:hypothetical protein
MTALVFVWTSFALGFNFINEQKRIVNTRPLLLVLDEHQLSLQ